MSQKSVSTLELEEEIQDCVDAHSRLLDYSRNAETLILPVETESVVMAQWTQDQQGILVDHFNYFEQMLLVIKQIKEAGPQTGKPTFPKRPKSKLDSLFNNQTKKIKTFDPKKLHEELIASFTDIDCEIDKLFFTTKMFVNKTDTEEQIVENLSRGFRHLKRSDALTLLLYIQFGRFLQLTKEWHEAQFNVGAIKETWAEWLKNKGGYSDRYARKLRNVSNVLFGFPQFARLGLPISYFTPGKLNDIKNLLTIPEYEQFWKQTVNIPSNKELHQSVEDTQL